MHLALRLLLDHLRISSAVHVNMHSQPNFCSLAGQAEALLKRFQKEGDPPPHNVTKSDEAFLSTRQTVIIAVSNVKNPPAKRHMLT